MKIFGTSQQASFQKKSANAAALRSTLQESAGDDSRSDRELDASLKLVLENEEKELPVRPAKEQAKPELIYRRHDLQKNEADDPVDDEPEEINSSMPGWLKGTLLMLSSAILFVLILFGVYMNLV